MTVAVKICGLSTAAALAAAIDGGARFVGFVFYPPSPRHLTIEQAAALAVTVPSRITRTGVFVDPDDAFLTQLLAKTPLDLLQLHGNETPERVAAIRSKFGKPVMKAVPLAGEADLAVAKRYFGVADRLIFDAKPPKDVEGLMPGGNGLVLDWELLRSRSWPLPWILSGGLTVENLGVAARTSGAQTLDVSSGVESAPGIKDIGKIRAFLARARQVSPL